MAIVQSKEVVNQAIKQIVSFYTGETKPLSTGVDHLDWHLCGGLKAGDVLGIVGLSSHGKTHFLERISRHLENTYEDVVFVKMLWELELMKVLIREMAEATNRSVRDVISKPPTEEEKAIYSQIAKKYRKENMLLQNEPVTPQTFEKDVMEVIKNNPDKKIILSIDNLENSLVQGTTQREAFDEIIRTINVLKKRHPYIVFIVLNQLNREILGRTNPENHFPTDADIFGSSSLLKLCDVLVVKHIPTRLGIEKYGVFSNKRYKYIEGDDFFYRGKNTSSFDAVGCSFYHYIKSRFIEEEYDRKDLFVERMFSAPKEEEEEHKSSKDFDY